MADLSILTKQLDAILLAYEAFKLKSRLSSSALDDSEIPAMISRCMAAIVRVSGKGSTYYTDATRILNENIIDIFKVTRLIGMIHALRSDLQNGYLKSLEEIIHSEVFSDYLDMAKHLAESGYKDAAAVIAGSTLESHLRKLAIKLGIEVVTTDGRTVKASKLNEDIAKGEGYSKLDQKNVTAWLDLRNNAAHGHYDKYQSEQVDLLIASVRDFITRNPA